MTAPALELVDIHKRFGDVVALSGAGLRVSPGSVHALLGENGAGKTTLMRIAYGLTTPDDGAVHVGGMPVSIRAPSDAIAAGVGMVQQHFTLVAAMTPLENIALGISSGRTASAATAHVAAQLGVRLSDVPAGELTVSEQQRIELLKALSRGARVLILDEPTAALAPPDADELFAWIRRFREQGGSVVLITHKLREALDIADEISVLRHGAIVWSGHRNEASIDSLVTAMLGESIVPADAPHEHHTSRGDAIAIANGLVVRDARGVVRVKGASLRVNGGEILGVAGVEGSGSRELLLALAGRAQNVSGELRVPDDIGFVSDDRQQDALLLNESITANVALRGARERRGWLRRADARAAAERLAHVAGIRVASVDLPVAALSGGNQQRLVIARELDGGPPLIVAINPTRGLDVVAASDVRRRLREAARAGTAVVYHTADLDELVDVSDRVVVVFNGDVRDARRDRESVGRAMLGAA